MSAANEKMVDVVDVTDERAKTLPLPHPTSPCAADGITLTAGGLLASMKPRKRHHRNFYVHAQVDTTAPSYQRDRAIFTLSIAFEPYGGQYSDRSVTRLDAPGWIGSGYRDETEVKPRSGDFSAYTTFSRASTNTFTPSSGYLSLSDERLSSYVRLLPRAALLSFRMTFDHYDTGPLPERGIHFDALDMEARWWVGGKERRTTFLLHASAGAHNYGRFGYAKDEARRIGQ